MPASRHIAVESCSRSRFLCFLSRKKPFLFLLSRPCRQSPASVPQNAPGRSCPAAPFLGPPLPLPALNGTVLVSVPGRRMPPGLSSSCPPSSVCTSWSGIPSVGWIGFLATASLSQMQIKLNGVRMKKTKNTKMSDQRLFLDLLLCFCCRCCCCSCVFNN